MTNQPLTVDTATAPPSPPAPAVPVAIARPRAATLLEEVQTAEADVLACRQAEVLAAGKASLWGLGAIASLVTAGAGIMTNPSQWLPIGYVGGSVAVSLGIGASLEKNKAEANRRVASTLNLTRPLDSVATAWQQGPRKQLHRFDQKVGDFLYQQWLAEVMGQTVTVENSEALETLAIANPALDLGQHPSNALIAGVPGAGKTLFYLAALDALAVHHPGIQVMVIDPKASPRETGTAMAPGEIHSKAIKKMTPDDAASWVMEALDEFRQWEGEKLLVLDEAAAVMASLKQSTRSLGHLQNFRGWLAHITSMGPGDGEYVWLISQDSSTEGLGISGALRGTMRAIGLVAPHNRQALKTFLTGQWLQLPDGGRGEVENIMNSSPTGRAVFDGKQDRWLPLPALENRTGWDRDNHRAVGRPQSIPDALPARYAMEAEASTPVAVLEAPGLSELEDWLNSRTTAIKVRDAQRSAPKKLEAKSADIRAAMTSLAARGYGEYDPATDVYTPSRH